MSETPTAQEPWYRRVERWGQTNITELDPRRYDIDWWREQWRRTRVGGVVINAGGIVAYYPSNLPLHHRAQFLDGRDLFGELTEAAHTDGLAVLARMDSNRADERFYREHPDWFTVDASGQPYREGELFIACLNGPYYDEFIPAVLREIAERARPEGFTDNSWSGLQRGRICACPYCARSFHDATGLALPRSADWDSQAYRHWIAWSYTCRVRVWERFQHVCRAAGGDDCLWLGMVGGDIVAQSNSFRDYLALCERSELIMLDYQTRSGQTPLWSNGEAGKLIHGLLGWEKPIAESIAMYGAGTPTFRVASKPEPEARLWAVEAFAGTIRPWWHHIGAFHEDRRQYQTAEPLFRLHEELAPYLLDREPVASIGLVYSQRSNDFYGRDHVVERCSLPLRGLSYALLRARLPYQMVHIDTIERHAPNLRALLLPNLGALSDAQADAVRRFVTRGGSLLATGETSLYDEWGDRRPDFALADLFGARATATFLGASHAAEASWERWSQHSYLRLAGLSSAPGSGPHPPLMDDGPAAPYAPPVPTGSRHDVLAGFDATDILPFGGRLEVVIARETATAPLTAIPPFPIYPPETAWMRQPATSLPALLLSEQSGNGRVAYLPADLDRLFARDNQPDHGDLLANLIRWTVAGDVPVRIAGPGLLDTHLYRQSGRLVLHIVNLTSAGTWRPPIHELIAVGPLRVAVHLPDDVRGALARLLVAGLQQPATVRDGWATFLVPDILDHEVIVVE